MRIKCYICHNDFKYFTVVKNTGMFDNFDFMLDACHRCKDKIRYSYVIDNIPNYIPAKQYKTYIKLYLKGCKI